MIAWVGITTQTCEIRGGKLMNKALNFFCGSVVFCIIFGSQYLNISSVKAAQTSVGINYKVQVQSTGWQKSVEMGQEAGTAGRRLETLNISLENPVQGMKLSYQSYVHTLGWQDSVSDGQDSGTIGKGLSIEAVKIKIVGVTGYHISYQVYVNNTWTPAVSDGAIAGIIGQSKQVEKIKINIVKDISLNYSAHVQNIAWQSQVSDLGVAGTIGQGLRVEALKINLEDALPGMKVEYQAHVQHIGWQDWVNNGQVAGTVGDGFQVEALKIKLSGVTGYHIQYQVHVQSLGWMPWVNDGDLAGTVGQSKRIEAIRIRIVKEQAQVSSQLLFIDSPQSNTTINDNQDLNITGRDLNQYGNKEVDVYCDGTLLGKATLDNQKYSYVIKAKLIPLGSHSITVEAIGNDQTIQRNSITVNVNKLQPRMFIDSPIANAVVSDSVDIKGWALSSFGVSNVKIFVDGNYINVATIGLAREDVNAVYPNYINGVNSGYSYTLDTSKLSLGSHTIQIQALGNDGVINQSSVLIIKGNSGNMQITNGLASFTGDYEGYSATPYTGVDTQNRTIGYGHVITSGETYTYLSQSSALNLLKQDLQIHVASVNVFTTGVNISQQQFDALVDFAYNCGDNALMQSTLLRKIKSGASMDEIKEQFLLWVHSNGIAYTGLYRRRMDEWNMFAYGDYTRSYISAPAGYK